MPALDLPAEWQQQVLTLLRSHVLVVDVHDWAVLPPAFKPAIEREHRELQGGTPRNASEAMS